MKVLILLVSIISLLLVLSDAKYFSKRETHDHHGTHAEIQADNGTSSEAEGTNVDAAAPAAETNSDDNKVTTEMPQDAPASVVDEANSGQSGAEPVAPAAGGTSDQGSSGLSSSETPAQNEEPAAQSSSETSVSSTDATDKGEDTKPATQISVEASSVVVIETHPVVDETTKDNNDNMPAKPEAPKETPATPAKEAETTTMEAETPAKAVETPTKTQPEQQPTNTSSTDNAVSEPVAAGSTKKNGNNSAVGFVASLVLVSLCLCLTANQ